MSNVSKTAKREKLRRQIAELSAKLTAATPVIVRGGINYYFTQRANTSIRYEKNKQSVNIRKRIDFLNRKLEKLE